ncbi:hypothetical protein JHK87_052525 [Glycine soja]|nr:hypothetical protein JHK87_052525 [Glycine soja]
MSDQAAPRWVEPKAVHPISNLLDLKRRLGIARRCFGYLHPAIPDLCNPQSYPGIHVMAFIQVSISKTAC